jgi:Tol biopolymer transport system component
MRRIRQIGAVAVLVLQACGGGSGAGSSLSPSAGGAQRIDRAESLSANSDATRVLYTGATDNPAGLPGNTAATQNVLLFNTATRQRALVSVTPAGNSAGSDDSSAARLSADGRFVVFASRARNLVTGVSYPTPAGGRPFVQIYARDLVNARTQLVSIDPTGATAGNDEASERFAVSADGRFVAFASQATNLVLGVRYPGGTNVFVRDLVAGTTELVSISADGGSAGFNGAVPIAPVHDSLFPAISDDGRYVAFTSSATNLVTGIAYPHVSASISNVFFRDRALRSTRIASVSQAGTQASNDVCSVARNAAARYLTPDGTTLVFTCRANNLLSAVYPANPSDVYLWSRDTGALTLVSRSGDGRASDNGASEAVISAEGRFVAFQSAASNLVTGVSYLVKGAPGGAAVVNIFRWDRTTGRMQLITVSRDRTSGADFDMQFPVISDDGSVIAFGSEATNVTNPAVPLTFDERQDNAAFWNGASNVVALASVDGSNAPMGFVNPLVALAGNGALVGFLWSSDHSAYMFRR